MWKSTEEANLGSPGSGALAARAEPNPQTSARVMVRIIRPDRTYRDVVVAGHFREEHLCSLVDDELCRLGDEESLIVHLFHVDSDLSRSLRDRWDEGLSDNRRVFVREVLGPTDDPGQIAVQLRHISHRLTLGERVNLAIRSPEVAEVARGQLRKLLLVSQRSETPRLHVWVHGDEDLQDRILEHLESIGVVRERDYQHFVQNHPEQRWRAPWLGVEPAHAAIKSKRRHRHTHRSADDSVKQWIRRVEQQREDRHQTRID